MPLKFTTLDDKMSIRIEAELKDWVIAYGYAIGFEGSYSDTIRFIVRENKERMYNDLPKEKQKELDQTLEYLTMQRKVKEKALIGELTDQLTEEVTNVQPEG